MDANAYCHDCGVTGTSREIRKHRSDMHDARLEMIPPALVRQRHDSDLYLPAEVARLFRVDPKTVARWAKLGRLNSVRTLGGHRRYRVAEVHALLAKEGL